jgi:uncharacterized protein YggT (Ycf19 family)
MDDQRNTEKVVEVQDTPKSQSDRQNSQVSKIIQIIWYIVGLVVALLAIRFVLALLGANLSNGFAQFIYQLTDPMVAPFRGLLQIGQFQAGVVRVEIETILAAFVYGLMGWGITAAIALAEKR